MLVFDPLDGSSNIDVNINVGTIFSILRRKPGRTGEVQLDEILQPGSEQGSRRLFPVRHFDHAGLYDRSGRAGVHT